MDFLPSTNFKLLNRTYRYAINNAVLLKFIISLMGDRTTTHSPAPPTPPPRAPQNVVTPLLATCETTKDGVTVLQLLYHANVFPTSFTLGV